MKLDPIPPFWFHAVLRAVGCRNQRRDAEIFRGTAEKVTQAQLLLLLQLPTKTTLNYYIVLYLLVVAT